MKQVFDINYINLLISSKYRLHYERANLAFLETAMAVSTNDI